MRLLLFILLLLPLNAFADQGDIVFVGQVPYPQDFTTSLSTFGNHLGGVSETPRGGDLFIRYSNGTIKNLTRSAGYGNAGFQGGTSIAVRDPAVHWDGNKVIFSMIIGGATQRYQVATYNWQLYEMTGLGINQTPVVTKVPNQPANYNNIMPTYGTDDHIIFSTDRPRRGETHLYPQRDEYESASTNTGLWSLNPANGELILLDHAPSGAFHPIIDSFGRVIYTRWDHLQRDQQNLANNPYGAKNYASEAVNAALTGTRTEVFPEPRDEANRTSPFLNLHTINQFFPWMINEDGTEHETLNHIGRHELLNYFDRTFNDDNNLDEYLGSMQFRANTYSTAAIHQLREDPLHPGRYLGIACPEFHTHASGQIVAINGAPQVSPRTMTVESLTHPDTAGTTATPNHSGMYRNPLILKNGTLIAAHTATTQEDSNIGTSTAPLSRYNLRLKQLTFSGGYYQPGANLTSGLPVNNTWWSPDDSLSYNGNLWEIQPVELVPRTRPQKLVSHLPQIETAVLAEEGMSQAELQNYLKQNDLALIVSRNVTSRDQADKQQPFNLKVADSNTKTIGAGGKVYDITHLQIFQGDLIRGYGNGMNSGRRVISQAMHDVQNPPGSPLGAVKIAADGSVAALVPAQRALTWELTNQNANGDEKGVVRERYWLTFQPGEIRVCTSCHGLNSVDQAGAGVPQNKPQALRDMLSYIKGLPPGAVPSATPTPEATGTATPTPDGSTYQLSVEGRDARNRVSTKSLTTGKNYSVKVARVTVGSEIEQLKWTLKVEGQSCSGSGKNLTLDSAGKKVVTGRSPAVRKNTKLTFQLLNNSAVKGTKSITLAKSASLRSVKQGALSAKEIQSLCKAFGQR